ncbi:cuticle protein 16.5-like [Plodia interpunctella]|uniref:cuticle protein 16.5-like n=1 Tax=Plodia interpunctella TaxID=58824 RepID=UPI0023684AB7|nr:cuticle protein 16.5-like [Plodia interpunctella]
MSPLVVLFAVIAAAAAAPQFLVQPPLHYQAHAFGHILKKRSIGHAVAYSLPSAVSHQSRVDVHSSPAVVTTAVAAPVVAEPAVVEARALYAAPAFYSAGSAVSHQSRVDVHSSPAVVAAAPVVAASPVVAARAVAPVVEARSLYAPAATVYAGGSAVTHQSRVDVKSSPAVVTEQLVAPVVEARSVWAPSVYTSTW